MVKRVFYLATSSLCLAFSSIVYANPLDNIPQANLNHAIKPNINIDSIIKRAKKSYNNLGFKSIVHQNMNMRNPALESLKKKFEAKAYHPSVYILISSSMPESLIRSYSVDSLVYDAPMVFKGIDSKHTLGWFMKKYILKYRLKFASPNFTIDPRPFSLWGVKSVPAIVFSTKPPICNKMIDFNGYKDCSKADPKTFWKLEGTTDVAWALQKFKDEGAPIPEKLIKNGIKRKKEKQGLSQEDYKGILQFLSQNQVQN